MVVGLIGIIYAQQRAENVRHARNIHALRNRVQAIILTLATKGIKVPKPEDEEDP